MDDKVKNAIEEYQCSGCITGSDITCFESNPFGGVGCGKHMAGTMITGGIGTIFLGMPKGFNRLGSNNSLKPVIYETFESSEWKYDMYNVPVWKHLNKAGHTLVRGFIPRKNDSFIHIFLEDCMDKINCIEITEDHMEKMD